MQPYRERLIRSLFDEYIEMYASRDERLIQRFSDNFSGFAGSSNVLVSNKQQWIDITRQDFAQVTQRINIEILDLSLQDLAEDLVTVTAFFHIQLPPPNPMPTLSDETARLVLIFRLEKHDWMITHSSISIPYGSAKKDEVYPVSKMAERNLALELMIKARTSELAAANKQLEILSNTDGLTQLGNRRFFDSTLEAEWRRSQRNNSPLALIMLDIDHFKQFNDHYGHPAGDNCLKQLASSIALAGKRSGELVARYGGEEFVVILPNLNKQAVVDIAQRIHDRVHCIAIPHVKTDLGVVTVSMGIAYSQATSQQSAAELISQADKALYLAKSAGRNCIKLYPNHLKMQESAS